MTSLSGESSTNDINLSGENIAYFTEVYADNIITNKLQSQDINLFTGVSANIQDQIDTINTQIQEGYTGGGFFGLVCVQSSGFGAGNYFVFGAGGVSTVYAPIQLNFAFNIKSYQIRANLSTATAATVYIQRNGTTILTINTAAAALNTTATCNLAFSAQDFISIYTQAGSGGSFVKMTLTCQTNGVVGPAGATPSFSIGTVTANAGAPTVTQTGTLTFPILNFNIPPGAQGAKGDKGDTGAQGPQGQQGPQGEAGGVTQAQLTAAILADAVAWAAADAAVLIAAETYTDAAGLIFEEEIGTLEGQILELQNATQNIIIPTIPAVTNFAGSIGAEDVNTDTLEAAVSITGLASIDIGSGAAVNTITGLTTNIYGTTVNVSSPSGFGVCNIGAPSDAVFVQGVPVYALLWSQWIPI